MLCLPFSPAQGLCPSSLWVTGKHGGSHSQPLTCKAPRPGSKRSPQQHSTGAGPEMGPGWLRGLAKETSVPLAAGAGR